MNKLAVPGTMLEAIRTFTDPQVAHDFFVYLAEQVFRYDERKNGDGPRFTKTIKGADERRLTYKTLMGKQIRA